MEQTEDYTSSSSLVNNRTKLSQHRDGLVDSHKKFDRKQLLMLGPGAITSGQRNVVEMVFRFSGSNSCSRDHPPEDLREEAMLAD